jgi:Fur family ferric uptake transcriptional regulator
MKANRTQQREVIFQELSKVRTHPTADEVYEMAKRRIPNISLATVYRNLEWMASHNRIRRINISGTKKRYDADTRRHYHIRCRECGRVYDITASELDEAEKILQKLEGRNGIEDFEIEFKGVCSECKGNK